MNAGRRVASCRHVGLQASFLGKLQVEFMILREKSFENMHVKVNAIGNGEEGKRVFAQDVNWRKAMTLGRRTVHTIHQGARRCERDQRVHVVKKK